MTGTEMPVTHADLIEKTFASVPRRVDQCGRRSVVIDETDLFRRVTVLVKAVQRITATQALLHLKRAIAHAN